jgi:O-antigen ligase
LGLALVSWLPVPNGAWGLWRTVAATIPQSGDFTSGRTLLWLQTLDAISERPWFGYGDGQLSQVVAFARDGSLAQPHNIGLQIIFAWGLIGTSCVLVLAIPFAIRATRSVRFSGGEWLPSFLGMIVLIVYSGFDGTLFYPLTLAIFAACAGHVAVCCFDPHERGSVIALRRHTAGNAEDVPEPAHASELPYPDTRI